MILAILNLYVTLMLPIVSAQSDFQFGRRCRLKNLKMATMVAILWIAKRNNFSNSESMSLWCFPSNFSSIWLMVWEEMFEEFRDLKNFSNSEALCPSDASHQVSVQSNLRFGKRCSMKNFKMATDASYQVSAQSDFQFGRRCRLKNFKMPTWPPWQPSCG